MLEFEIEQIRNVGFEFEACGQICLFAGTCPDYEYSF
jgi:hypothetical protein